MLRFSTALLALFVLLGFSSSLAQHSSSPAAPSFDSSAVPPPSSSEQAPDASNPVWGDVRSTVSSHADDYIGADHEYDTPYAQESDVYRAAPPIRYNRVDGLVLGLQRNPLQPNSTEHARVFGQLAYAFGLNDVRYTAGLESMLYATAPTSLRLGVQYHEQTVSPDRWKTSHLENSLTSLGFADDFFDYYEAEGLTAYATQTLPHTVQITVGVRAEAHRSLPQHTNWSLFNGGPFRSNPSIEDGDLRALFAEGTAGTISNADALPSGGAVRVAATVADGLGGDFAFYRYEADARGFLPLTPDTRLGLRLRGGYATSGAPVQAHFALGGIGSMRGYAQNGIRGTRAVLANAEYLIDGATLFDDVLDDLFVAGLLDAGWVGGSADAFRTEDILPSAGFGVGLDERQVRLDVVWPLRDAPVASQSPSVRLRLAPSF